METWHVSIGFKTRASLNEDLVFDLSTRLEHFGAAMSVSQDFLASTIALTVDEKTWEEALETARSAVFDTWRALDIEASVTAVTVQNEETFQEELHEPVYPDVVGYAEIAKMAGVSRQRVRQLTERDIFPRPVIRTAQGPLYSVHAVERWLETRGSSAPSAASTKTA